MTISADFPGRFRDCLRSVAVASPEARVFPADSGPYQYFGELISPNFEGMDEAERQRLVFDRILERLDERDRERIAFIYTDAPSERDKNSSDTVPTTSSPTESSALRR